jgi:hypothetical protein
MLYTILYTSSANRTFDEDELVDLLVRSRTWNDSHGITGCLAYVEGLLHGNTQCKFIHVLEGSKSSVQQFFAKIKLDNRYGDLTVIKKGKIDQRKFATWKMGVDRIQLNDNPVLQYFFSMESDVLTKDGDAENNMLMDFMEAFYNQKKSFELECLNYQEFGMLQNVL